MYEVSFAEGVTLLKKKERSDFKVKKTLKLFNGDAGMNFKCDLLKCVRISVPNLHSPKKGIILEQANRTCQQTDPESGLVLLLRARSSFFIQRDKGIQSDL